MGTIVDTSKSVSMASSASNPKVLVFDLDGCVWDPAMYQLYGGAPFKSHSNGEYLTDKRGERIHLLGDIREILHEIKTSRDWSETAIAVASTCDEPDWARECISKFSIGDGYVLKDVFPVNLTEIYYASSKQAHFK